MNCIITFKNGKVENWAVSEERAKHYGNVNNVIFLEWQKDTISRIEVEMMNNQGGTYKDRTYDIQLEQWKHDHARIEAINKPGYEDFTGYGARTEGKKARFYVGKSTGWIPIYLAIDNSRSSGGPAISFSCIESMRRVR